MMINPSIPARLFAILVMVLGLTTGSAAGQFEPPPGMSGGGSSEVRVQVRPLRDKVTPGDQIPIAVIFDIEPGWHINPEVPVVPKALEGWVATPTVVEVASAGGTNVGPVQWPETHQVGVDYMFSGKPVMIDVFEGVVVMYVPVAIPSEAEPGSVLTLGVTVAWGACDDMTCLPPEERVLPVSLEVVTLDELAALDLPGTPDPVFDAFESGVFADMLSGVGAASPARADADAEFVDLQFFGLKVPRMTGAFGLALLLLLSAVGGFILNLTPCVLPVIPIKVLTISKHAGTPGRSLVLGLWMAFGVVAFWVGIGLPVAFVNSITDPSRIFGIWWMTLLIGLLIGVMGMGLMGLFSITLPQRVYAVNPKTDSLGGSFVFGVMTAVLGLPCFGFVAAGVLGIAATFESPWVVLGVFGAIGVGMALPYMVLSAKPSLLEKMPRTGPASELVKQVMGLLLLAASAYFAGSGLIALVAERPYLGRELHLWAVAGFAVLAGLLLLVRTFQITKGVGKRAFFSVVAVVVGGVAVLYALSSTGAARSTYEARMAAGGGQHGVLLTGAWIEYSPELFEEARAAGHVVVLDFTAEWCINCQVLWTQVLNREPVKSALASDRIVSMEVDLTSSKATGWDRLQSLGQTGIPLLAVYTPGEDTPWMAGAYTGDQVVRAVETALAAGPGAGGSTETALTTRDD